MSNEAKHPKQEDENITMSKGDFAALMARVNKLENPEMETSNPIIASTCNSCGQPANEKGICPTHPHEHVNHVAMGLDTETGLKRPRIARQTRV